MIKYMKKEQKAWKLERRKTDGGLALLEGSQQVVTWKVAVSQHLRRAGNTCLGWIFVGLYHVNACGLYRLLCFIRVCLLPTCN